MPGNIAIVGAPKAGKSELAEKLQRQLNLDAANRYARIDNVAAGSTKSISHTTNAAVGLWAPYVINSMIASERVRREVANTRKGFQLISVGTILDTIVYQSCHSAKLAEQSREDVTRAQIMMQWLGMLFSDMWPYDHVLLLENSTTLLEVERVYEQQLVEALSLYQVPYARLTGTFEETVEQALAYIEGPGDPAATEADERGVRKSGEARLEDGDSTGPVPGVPNEDREDRPGQLRRAEWSDVSLQGSDAFVRLREIQEASEALPGSEHSG